MRTYLVLFCLLFTILTSCTTPRLNSNEVLLGQKDNKLFLILAEDRTELKQVDSIFLYEWDGKLKNPTEIISGKEFIGLDDIQSDNKVIIFTWHTGKCKTRDGECVQAKEGFYYADLTNMTSYVTIIDEGIKTHTLGEPQAILLVDNIPWVFFPKEKKMVRFVNQQAQETLLDETAKIEYSKFEERGETILLYYSTRSWNRLPEGGTYHHVNVSKITFSRTGDLIESSIIGTDEGVGAEVGYTIEDAGTIVFKKHISLMDIDIEQIESDGKTYLFPDCHFEDFISLKTCWISMILREGEQETMKKIYTHRYTSDQPLYQSAPNVKFLPLSCIYTDRFFCAMTAKGQYGKNKNLLISFDKQGSLLSENCIDC